MSKDATDWKYGLRAQVGERYSLSDMCEAVGLKLTTDPVTPHQETEQNFVYVCPVDWKNASFPRLSLQALLFLELLLTRVWM